MDSSGPSPFVIPELMNRCMGDSKIACLVLDKLEQQLKSDLAEFDRQARAGDIDGIARRAHALKGAAGAVAAQKLHELAAQLERSARAGAVDALAAEVATLRTEVDRCLQHLPATKQGLTGGTANAPERR